LQGFEVYYGLRGKVAAWDNSAIAEIILKSNTALLYYWDSLEIVFSRNYTKMQPEEFLCEVISAFPVGNPDKSGMVLPKGSPYKETFNLR